MSSIRAFAMILAILSLCASGLHAQRRIVGDAAAVAAGGTAGAVIGQQVGKEISPIFGKVGAVTTKAAAVEGVPKTPVILQGDTEAPAEAIPQPDGVTAPAQTAQPAQPQPVQRAAAPQLPAQPRRAPEPDFLAPVFASPPASLLTKDDLAGVHTGIEREQLVTTLGSPSARVIIPEDGQLRELYLYSGRGAHLGTVELTDGAVSAVNVSRF